MSLLTSENLLLLFSWGAFEVLILCLPAMERSLKRTSEARLKKEQRDSVTK